MKASRFALSDRFVPLVAAVFLAAHLPSLAPSLEDIDSINFALGLHDYDPAKHQPHPPGYPVYIAAGRAVLAVVRMVAPAMERSRADALTLALVSAVAGALAIVAAMALFRRMASVRSSTEGPRVDGEAGRVSLSATLLLAAAPLFWMTSLRPLSDVPGLAAILAAQALLLRGSSDPRALVAASLVTGLAIGIRSQSAWLTLPLMVWAFWRARTFGGGRVVAPPMAALVAGVLVWLVPVLVLTHGISGYLAALGSQAGEDFAWVNMLWGDPTPRHLAFALFQTFVLPWASIPVAVVVLVAAVGGVVVLLLRAPQTLAVVLLAFAPYVAFDLLFQETVTIRYALPVMVPIAYLAACGFVAIGRPGVILSAAVALFALVVSGPAGWAYGRDAHPAFRAIEDMTRAAAVTPPSAVHAHFALRRPLQASAASTLPVVEPRRSYEWLGLTDYWRGGGRGVLWFLADPRRTDLALIDPQSLRDVVRYRWDVEGRPEVGGTRPLGVDWYRLHPPGWFALEGWSLTPETGGLARATGKGLDRQSITAYVRRRAEPVTVMVGGRDIGAATEPSIVTLAIDGAAADEWRFDPKASPNFLRFIQLPHGIQSRQDDYATLTISARAERSGAPTPEVAIRQFDLQPADGLIRGFGDGWHEEEFDYATGRRWRWTSDRSILRIVPPQPVVITLRGESPMRYFDAPPRVRLTAGTRVIAELHPDADFQWRVAVPADASASANGEIAIETDRVYLPGRAEGTADTRRLGLRLLEIRVEPQSVN